MFWVDMSRGVGVYHRSISNIYNIDSNFECSYPFSDCLHLTIICWKSQTALTLSDDGVTATHDFINILTVPSQCFISRQHHGWWRKCFISRQHHGWWRKWEFKCVYLMAADTITVMTVSIYLYIAVTHTWTRWLIN